MVVEAREDPAACIALLQPVLDGWEAPARPAVGRPR